MKTRVIDMTAGAVNREVERRRVRGAARADTRAEQPWLHADVLTGVMRCDHCGAVGDMDADADVAQVLRAVGDFRLRHHGCPPPRHLRVVRDDG